MLFHALPQLLKGALYACLTLFLIFLLSSDLGLLFKAGGTLGLLVIAGLIGWYGAALRAWRHKRRGVS